MTQQKNMRQRQRQGVSRSIERLAPRGNSSECQSINALEYGNTAGTGEHLRRGRKLVVAVRSVLLQLMCLSLYSKLKIHKAGAKPSIKAVVIKASKHAFKKTKYFFHRGQRRGSLTLSEGWGTRIMFVPQRWVLWTIWNVSAVSIN
jgi:hypothetical protein